MEQEPPWEQGWLEKLEWDTPLLNEEGVVQDGFGVALCSRKTFLEKVDWWVSGRKLAVILPGNRGWFHDAKLTNAAIAALDGAKVISFTFNYRTPTGETRRTPKQGTLVQLGARRVAQIIPEVHKVATQSYTEITLSINREATPPEVWRSVKMNREKYFNESLVRLMGDPAPVFKRVVPYDRGEDCVQTTIKVLPGHVENILVNADKHHISARLTMRNGENHDGFEILWMERTKDNTLAQEVRLFREKATRLAGKEFRGITFRGRGDSGRWRAQVGLRVTPGTVAKIRHHFLREDQLPIPEARAIKQDMLWIMKGLPPDFEARTLARAIHGHLQWPVVALKELSRPNVVTATWLVSSADRPPRETWWIDAGGQGITLATISQKIEGPKGGWKARGNRMKG